MHSERQSYVIKIESSKPRWTREQRPSEKELLESLCNEIQLLRYHSNMFETQYKSLQNYYQSLSRHIITWT